jgi:hypothetical protein
MTTASDTKLDIEDWLLSLLRKQRQIRAKAAKIKSEGSADPASV